jgi:pre-mRNA cleavage complex 2 protein Pcf11
VAQPATAQSSSSPPTPPPPVISGDKDGWAKLKTPAKSDASCSEPNRVSEVGRADRPGRGRAKLYSKAPEERRRGARDYERNADRNIEIIMKQAAEQLNQGTITKSQYNKLIQEVLHMSEDQKLRAAQRKEREGKLWERSEKGMRLKEHGVHPRPPG